MNEKTKLYIEVDKMLDEITQEVMDETLRCFKDGLNQGEHKCGQVFDMICKLRAYVLEYAMK